jgi:sirohydrochlorin cobaltochelatase
VTVALILAGHGSHISPNTAGVVWGYVDTLRRRGVADEVTACFWKEQPHFHQVLQTVKSDTVVIVALFTAQGYFSQQVIPSEMGLLPLTPKSPLPQGARGLDKDWLHNEGVIHYAPTTEKIIYYTRTLGEHLYLETIVQQRVRDALHDANLASDDTAVAIIGHGTNRSATTRKTTIHQVRQVQKLNLVAEVIDAYLDDEPNIPSIYERTTAQNLVAVPFFLASGSHTTQDVPLALGIEYGGYPANVNGRDVYYTPPIGTDDVICDLIIELARDSGLPFAEQPTNDVWSGFPQTGWDVFAGTWRDMLLHHEYFTFGQLQISANAVQPIDSTQAIQLDNPVALRRHIRENPFRSLTTSDDLPTDWIIRVDAPEQIAAIVETVYPGAIANWAANQWGEFQAETLATVIERQQGMFQSLATVDKTTIAHHVNSVCGRCMRHPTWHEGQTSRNSIPCSAPCNHWLSSIMEAINEG